MFQASIHPSSGEQECALPHMVFCTGCDVCGCVELGRTLCALWKLLFESNSNFHSAHSLRPSSIQPQPSQPYAAVHTLVLLMMGIVMPETCWDTSLIINIGLVASCWFLSLHPTFESTFGRSKLLMQQEYCNFTNVLSFSFWNSNPDSQRSLDLTTGRILTVCCSHYIIYVCERIYCLSFCCWYSTYRILRRHTKPIIIKSICSSSSLPFYTISHKTKTWPLVPFLYYQTQTQISCQSWILQNEQLWQLLQDRWDV